MTSRSSRRSSLAQRKPPAHGKKIEETIAALPDALEVLKLHYLRRVLFDIGTETYFLYHVVRGSPGPDRSTASGAEPRVIVRRGRKRVVSS